jgi:hypothetical protein
MSQENTQLTSIFGKLGGTAYALLAVASAVLAYLHLATELYESATKNAPYPNDPKINPAEPFVYFAAIGCFVAGLIFYRILALRRGYHETWIWWAILASGLLMIVAGLVSGRYVLIFFGVSNLLHCAGTKSLYFGEKQA